MTPVIVLGFLAAGLALWKRLQAPALFLATLLTQDVLRPLLAPLRAGYTKPYEGLGFGLWLGTDVALFLAPPSALLWALGHRWLGILMWVGSVATVGVLYPGLRGEALIGAYAAYYLAVYTFAVALVSVRASWRERLLREELALLWLVLTGIMSVVLVHVYGIEKWWACWVPNASGYLALIALSLWPAPPHGSNSRDGGVACGS